MVEPNLSRQGIAVLENSLELNGGSIKSAASDTDAELVHDGRDHDPQHKVDWQRTQPNRAPVVDTEARNYEFFTGQPNIPRGFLFSKSFYQVFTDPDGDELTYSVSVSEHHRQLLDDLSIGLDYRTPENSHRPLTVFHRVWFEVDADDNWEAITPALPDPVMVTATLTATDPEGMSVSLDGSILIDWESHPEVVRAVASEQAIELTFDVAVAADPAPTAEQFTVNVVNGDGTAGTVSVNDVSVNGAVVTLGLGLGTELASGQSVTVDYAHDDDTPLKRAARRWRPCGQLHRPGRCGAGAAGGGVEPGGDCRAGQQVVAGDLGRGGWRDFVQAALAAVRWGVPGGQCGHRQRPHRGRHRIGLRPVGGAAARLQRRWLRT